MHSEIAANAKLLARLVSDKGYFHEISKGLKQREEAVENYLFDHMRDELRTPGAPLDVVIVNICGRPMAMSEKRLDAMTESFRQHNIAADAAIHQVGSKSESELMGPKKKSKKQKRAEEAAAADHSGLFTGK